MARRAKAKVDIENLIANETIEIADMKDELENAMLNYAVEVITDRALPNVYDGLKPIQRRILYAGLAKKYLSNGPFVKCAKYVGDVIGSWSPHGDASAYLALTALAQPWMQRYPLIAFHGNVGSYDGDEAAHMRYCVTGDTLVNTNEGLIRIDELAVTSSDKNDIINQLYGDDVDINYIIESRDGTNKAVRLFNSGVHDIIHITTKYGYTLRGTSNHPIIANNNWKLLRDIQIGDLATLNIKTNQVSTTHDLIDRHNIDILFDSPIDDIDRILQSSKPIQKYFLQKYADQYAFFRDNELVIRFEDETICRQIHILLLTFGIVCAREKTLLIINEYLYNFYEYIGFTSVEKQKQLNDIITTAQLINEPFIQLPIISVNYEAPQTVYSIKVDSECHSFTANGFINHNTEAKLTKLAEIDLDGISNNAVDMIPNYSDTTIEPTILPSAFPALLCNGSYGIAVGYTSNIPAHNLNEVLAAIIAYIKNNDITLDELMKIIPGPDIATGGLLINNDEIRKLYETGKGNLSFRAKYTIEVNDKNDTSAIHIIELPPRVNKLKLLEKLRDICIINKKIPRVTSVTDLSTDTTNIVIQLAKGAVVDYIIKALFEQTDLSYNISYIMRAVQQNKPILFTLKDALAYYVEHRRSCLSRENLTLLQKAEQKKHSLLGLAALTKNLKRAINIIENAENDNIAKQQLKLAFKLDDIQVEAILEVKLRRLTKLNREDILNNIQSLDNEITLYTNRKNNIKLIDDLIIQQCTELKKKFGDKRRTEIIEPISSSEETAKDVVIALTNKNTIKLLSSEVYTEIVQSGIFKEKNEVYTKIINTRSDDNFIIILEDGTCIRTDFNNLIAWNNKIKIINIYPQTDDNATVIILTAFGLVQKIKLSSFKIRMNKITPIFKNWSTDDSIIYSELIDDNEVVSILTQKGLLHRFYIASLKEHVSIGKLGLATTNLVDDRIISAVISKESDKYICIYTKHMNNYGRKITNASLFTPKARTGKGILSISFFKKNPGEVYALAVVNDVYVDIDSKGKLQVVDVNKCALSLRTGKPEDINYDPLVINFNKGK